MSVHHFATGTADGGGGSGGNYWRKTTEEILEELLEENTWTPEEFEAQALKECDAFGPATGTVARAAMANGILAGKRACMKERPEDRALRDTSRIMQFTNPMDKIMYTAKLSKGEMPLCAADACYLRWMRDADGGSGPFPNMFGHLDIDSV